MIYNYAENWVKPSFLRSPQKKMLRWRVDNKYLNRGVHTRDVEHLPVFTNQDNYRP